MKLNFKVFFITIVSFSALFYIVGWGHVSAVFGQTPSQIPTISQLPSPTIAPNPNRSTTEIVIQSDSTWKVSKLLYPDWMRANFNDSAWIYSVSPSVGVCGDFKGEKRITANPMWAPLPTARETVYFRKKFELSEKPETATMRSVFDDDGEIYINGTLVRNDKSGSINPGVFVDNISAVLNQGENLIAIKAIDSSGGCQSASVQVEVVVDENTKTLAIPALKQTNPQWASASYAHAIQANQNVQNLECGTTISDCGCVITSLAMMLNHFGVTHSPEGTDTSPLSLNTYFQQNPQCSENGCVSRGYAYGNVIWSAVDKYTREAYVRYGSQKLIYNWQQSGQYNKNIVLDYINNLKPSILKAQQKNHWMLVRGYNSNTLFINDPYYSATTLADSLYQNTADQMRLYDKTNSDFSMIQVVAPVGQQVIVKDSQGRRTGYDVSTNKVVTEIPNSKYQFDEVVIAPEGEASSKGVYSVFVSLPVEGQYTIETAYEDRLGEFAVYSYNKDAESIEKLVKNTSYRFEYNPQPGNPVMKEIKTVKIDVKPRSKDNTFVCNRHGWVPVAVLSSKDFDPQYIDSKSVTFAGAKPYKFFPLFILQKVAVMDLNNDKKRDKVFYFRIKDVKVGCRKATMELLGKTVDGTSFMGSDVVDLKMQKRSVRR